MRNRVLLAFAVAPLAATAVVWVWLAVSGQAPNPAFTFSVLFYAYVTAGIFGVPAYFLTSSRNLQAPTDMRLLGLLSAWYQLVCFPGSRPTCPFIIGIVVASAVAGLVFGLIARRNLTIVGGVRESR